MATKSNNFEYLILFFPPVAKKITPKKYFETIIVAFLILAYLTEKHFFPLNSLILVWSSNCNHAELSSAVLPQALSLCGYLEREPGLVAGQRVLELGAGTGLVGLVAHALGKPAVTSSLPPSVSFSHCMTGPHGGGEWEGNGRGGEGMGRWLMLLVSQW